MLNLNMLSTILKWKLIFLSAALLLVLTAAPVLASNVESWYWDIDNHDPPENTWDVWWDSNWSETQAGDSMFPSDVRDDIRQSAFQWDAYNHGDSLLEFEEGATNELDVDKKDFDDAGWDDIPGKHEKVVSGNLVQSADVWLNDDWGWTAEEMVEAWHRADVMTVTIHEIGHTVGLSHPGSGCGAISSLCTTYRIMRSITSHDEDHLETKY